MLLRVTSARLPCQGIGSVRTQQGFREGELMHTRLDMSDAERQELFGDIDASSFR